MKHFLPLISLFLCACAQMDYHATAANGSQEDISIKTFGGSQSIDSAGGTRWTTNHNKTAGQFFQFATAVAGGIANSVNVGHVEKTAQIKDTNAAGVTTNASNNAAKTEQLGIITNGANEAAKISKQ